MLAIAFKFQAQALGIGKQADGSGGFTGLVELGGENRELLKRLITNG
jgi:hypothetical protein